MLGYDGQVAFRPLAGTAGGSGGLRGMAMGAMTGEANPMMAAEGQGSVLYGYRGLHVAVIELTHQAPFVCEADRLLCYDHSISTSLESVGAGGIRGMAQGMATGQGLFTTRLQGQGQIAILSHGSVFDIPVDGPGVFVDPQAYVGHQGNVQVEFTAKVGWRDAVGRGSGEATQLKLSGQGRVFVQPSEHKF